MVQVFSRLIREIRQRYGYSQRDLADEIGTVTSTVGHWETNRSPSRSCLDQLIQHFPEYRARLHVAARLLPLQPGADRETAQDFGDLIREIREQYGYRQTDLAEAIGTNKTTVSSWETNKRIASRLYIEDLARRFPKYKSRLYVAARRLPLEIDAESEYQLRSVLEDAQGDLTFSECLEQRP